MDLLLPRMVSKVGVSRLFNIYRLDSSKTLDWNTCAGTFLNLKFIYEITGGNGFSRDDFFIGSNLIVCLDQVNFGKDLDNRELVSKIMCIYGGYLSGIVLAFRLR